MYDLAVNSSDSVQQTAAGSCSTDTVPHAHHNFNARSFCKYKAVIMASITAAQAKHFRDHEACFTKYLTTILP